MEPRRAISIFIIDPDQMLATAIRYDLEKTFPRYELRITGFASVGEALPRLADWPALILLADGFKDGGIWDERRLIELLGRACPAAEVIMLGENTLDDTTAKALEYGIHDYIVKDDHLFQRLGLSVGQCLKIQELKHKVSVERAKSRMVMVSAAVIAGALFALQFLVPRFAGH